MCSDDAPSHIDATSVSSYAQVFSENEAVFYHGTDAVVIAIALTINKKADAAELRQASL